MDGGHHNQSPAEVGSQTAELDSLAATVGQTVAAWQSMLDKALQRASIAEQAAAMWQERARNLEAQVEQLLALPAHEEEPVAGRRWWRFWRRVD